MAGKLGNVFMVNELNITEGIFLPASCATSHTALHTNADIDFSCSIDHTLRCNKFKLPKSCSSSEEIQKTSDFLFFFKNATVLNLKSQANF